MHELPVTENILNIALRHAKDAGASRITDVYLVIGARSSIADDSVQFYWDILSKDTPAEGGQLHFRRIPTEMVCLSCSRRYAPEGEDLACPNCGGVSIKVVAGEEFYLEAIDVDGGVVKRGA
jgi:hydrogenase nickel incorporation protein HypA/HybF